MSDPNVSTDALSPTFLDFCVKVRNNDPSILPEPGQPFNIRRWRMDEKEDIELADALLENTNVTYLQFDTEKYTKISAEAMAKYLRTSKRLQRIHWNGDQNCEEDRVLRQRHEEIRCCFLAAFQESTSLKELHIELPRIGESSNRALKSMLTHTQGLQSLCLRCPVDNLDDWATAASSGLKKNTTLRELTLDLWRGPTDVTPILTSLRDHPHLRRLCFLCGYMTDITGLETVLLSVNSKLTELDIEIGNMFSGDPPMMGLTNVLQALAHHPTLIKLALRRGHLCPDETRLLRMALRNISSLQSLLLTGGTLGSDELAQLAPALYRCKSIKLLDISGNGLKDMDSARLLRDIIRRNKTITSLILSVNKFGRTTGAVECIADGLGSNSTLLHINLSWCALGDVGVSNLAQTLGSRNTTLQKLLIGANSVTSSSVAVLLTRIEQRSHRISELDLQCNKIGNKGAILLARSLGKNALLNLTRLSLSNCHIEDDGFITLVSALEQNTSLLYLDLRNNCNFSERAFLVLAESLPEIKVLQRFSFSYCPGLAAAMPLLLAGLRKNNSLFRFQVSGCAPSSVPPTVEETARCVGSWMQEMERLGYRNRFCPLIRAPEESLPLRGLWPHALARVATLPDVIFEVLRSKPSLVPTEDTESIEGAKDTGVPSKRKRGEE
jgi:hypothetical protein